LDTEGYPDRPPNRPDDWTEAASSPTPTAHRPKDDAGFGTSSGGFLLEPELDPKRRPRSLGELEAEPTEDEDFDEVEVPNAASRAMVRTARLASLDPDDGIPL
jgi:type IV secretion system protein VirD4